MAERRQFIRFATTAEQQQFTGLEGEITVDLQAKALVMHDGVTPGGHPAGTQSDLATKESLANKVNVIDGSADNKKYPSAIAVYDYAAKKDLSNVAQAYTQLQATSGNINLAVNQVYKLSINDATNFVLPSEVDTTKFNQIVLLLTVTGTPTVNWDTDEFYNGVAPTIETGEYVVFIDYSLSLSKWVVGALPYSQVVVEQS